MGILLSILAGACILAADNASMKAKIDANQEQVLRLLEEKDKLMQQTVRAAVGAATAHSMETCVKLTYSAKNERLHKKD